MKVLVRKCWDHEPGNRPTFDEIGVEISRWRAADFGEEREVEDVNDSFVLEKNGSFEGNIGSADLRDADFEV
jgi:hypothetical protein